ncbi:MAG: 2-oxo acid dehydrogenase subunit E2 [Spirochaeta sp.]|jgi:pyruvate/2-oxoglutarate dehydrogenase complex dihydrolipoamide acyltransferase (E2) component|nr:2-oxo acid dehydrogenase subunit E2 [Spirochaeta sp.]
MYDHARRETFPRSRLATFDVGAIGRGKHHITGLLEIDVTTGRERLRRLRRDGTSISFTAWIVKSIATAVAETPEVHGILAGGRKRVVFTEVDVALMVERTVDGTAVPLPVLLPQSETRTLGDIDSRIAGAATQTVTGPEDYQLGRRRSKFLMALYYRLPQPIRIRIMKRILSNPSRHKATMGTVVVSSLTAGMRFPGWILPTSMHNLVFGVGSVVRKPRVVNEQVLPRDVLHLTVMFDHDVVDGAPAARFISRLVRKLETATVLENPAE